MTRLLFILGSILLVATLILFAGLWILAKQSGKTSPERLSDRKLGDYSEKPNYVSSLVENPDSFIEPLSFTVDPAEAWEAAIETVRAIPKAKIVVEESSYLHAEYRTSVFGFVDDLELQLIPEERQIHVRSESRVGHSDMGANRNRVEKLRSDFTSALED